MTVLCLAYSPCQLCLKPHGGHLCHQPQNHPGPHHSHAHCPQQWQNTNRKAQA